MFYKRWSQSVALPLGPQWGDPDNGRGGVAACMVWSRKEDQTKRPRSAAPAATSMKSALKVTGKGISSGKDQPRLNEQDVVSAVHQANAQRPATATGVTGRQWRPFNPTPPPSRNKPNFSQSKPKFSQRKAHPFQGKTHFSSQTHPSKGIQLQKRTGASSRNDSPEEVTGWTYKFREKNIYDLYDTDGFRSPSTVSRPDSVPVYVPSPDLINREVQSRALRSRNGTSSPQRVGDETEFTVHTKDRQGRIGSGDGKYERLSKELDRAIATIRDLTKFQKDTLSLYQAQSNQILANQQGITTNQGVAPLNQMILQQKVDPTFITTYNRDFTGRQNKVRHGFKAASTTLPSGPEGNALNLGFKVQPPPGTTRDFVKENSRPQVVPRSLQMVPGNAQVPGNFHRMPGTQVVPKEAWTSSNLNGTSKIHSLKGPNGLMTIRVDCGEKPVKNITVRLLDENKTPQVFVDH